jgi:hypothetical protein
VYPAYSSGLSPCNMHIFGMLEKALKDHMLTFDCDVQDAMVKWCRLWLKEFWLMYEG